MNHAVETVLLLNIAVPSALGQTPTETQTNADFGRFLVKISGFGAASLMDLFQVLVEVKTAAAASSGGLLSFFPSDV